MVAPDGVDKTAILRGNATTLLAIWAVVGGLSFAFAIGAVYAMDSLGVLTPEFASASFAIGAIVAVIASISLTFIVTPARGSSTSGTSIATILRYVILGFLPVAVFGLGLAFAANAHEPSVALGIVLVTGVIGLLLMLAVIAVFFQGLGLTDPTEALGLPRGSIRAAIALALILVFVILSVYLYSTLQGGPEAPDIAKQLITTLGTLVVAVASFYFGANSVQTATASIATFAQPASLTVTPPDPLPPLDQGPTGAWSPAEIKFTSRRQPPGAKVSATVGGDPTGTIDTNGDDFIYRPGSPQGQVLLVFRMPDYPSVPAQTFALTAPGVIEAVAGDAAVAAEEPAPSESRELREPFK